ncbi:MAG: hypothetical protein WC450_06760 [Candidatus Omnitrophota bacterium]
MNKTMVVLLMSLGFFVLACGNQLTQAADPLDTVAAEVSEVEAVAEKDPLAEDLAEKAKTLLARAQKYLDEGKLEDAIAVAQNILSFDPQNIDAKTILETAQTKLADIAAEKAQDVTSGLVDTLGTTEE